MARLVRAGHTAQLVRAVSRIHWGESPIAIHVYRGGPSEPPPVSLSIRTLNVSPGIKVYHMVFTFYLDLESFSIS